MNRLKVWSREHPFLLALLVLVAVAVPGFVRVEDVAGQAHDAVVQVAAGQVDTCRSLNVARGLSRDALHALVDAVGQAGTPPALTARLRAAIPTADDQDQDCDGDGELTPLDYDRS